MAELATHFHGYFALKGDNMLSSVSGPTEALEKFKKLFHEDEQNDNAVLVRCVDEEEGLG